MTKADAASRDEKSRLERILASPSYRRADADLDFLSRDELRSLRLQLEYLKPELSFAENGIKHTIVVFGGARVIAPDAARSDLERLVRAGAPDEERQRAAERLERSRYYDIACDLGRLIAQCGEGPDDNRLVLATGGGPGLMEAANRGACEAGAASIGLGIMLPHEQRPNPYITPHLSFQFRYFALRKMHFMMRARALVAFPGGFGTFDEVFETLCLIQTGKREPIPVVLVGGDFWSRAVDIPFLVAEGMIDERDAALFSVAETATDVWLQITDWYASRGRSLIE